MQNAGPGEIDIDRDDIWKAFAMFDTNGDGFIPSTYILPALKTLGWYVYVYIEIVYIYIYKYIYTGFGALAGALYGGSVVYAMEFMLMCAIPMTHNTKGR